MEELLRRANTLKYFEGAGDFRSGEGFGYLVGGALSIIMGAVILPILVGGFTTSGIDRYLFWGMAGLGVLMSIKGVFEMRREDKTPRTPITDEQFDEITAFDLAYAKETAAETLQRTFGLAPDTEFLHLVGPNYYTANRHIPILWKADGKGRIRYSNFALVTFAFRDDNVYSYNCILNHRDGILSKPNTFSYESGQIGEMRIADREVERLSGDHKIEKKNVCMLLFDIEGREEINELSVILADYGVERKTGGQFDRTETMATAERIQALLKTQSAKKLISKNTD